MDWKSATTKDDGTISIPDRWLHLHYYEALNILFRMENSLRVFVYVVLKNKFKEKWAETALQTLEEEKSTIAATAARRIAQAKGYGYLGYEISSPLMYLNSGELTRIITSDSYWELFKPFFRGKKEIIKTKLDEIGTVRNALAHFRPLKYDDIELIKQNVKHAFVGIEQCLAEMTQTYRIVPTNTTDEWYKSLITLGSNLCTLQLFQDKSEKWIRIEVGYACVMLANPGPGRYRGFSVSNLISPEIIKRAPKLARHCIFLFESIPHVSVTADNSPKFKKNVSLVFNRTSLIENFQEIGAQVKELLLKIETESELVQKDNLARGALVDAVRIWSSLKGSGDTKWWSTTTDEMKSQFGENDPPEYWGTMNISGGDFIAGSYQYPWMPSDISKDEDIFG